MTKYNEKINKLDGSMIEIEAKIDWSDVTKHKSVVIKKYSESLTLDGFRKGHIPDDVVVKNVGEANINADMAEMALQVAYPEIVKENALKVIGSPQISITKIATGNPLEFKIKVSTLPEVKLPNYKTISKEVLASVTGDKDIKVGEKEIEDAIKHIRTQWARSEKMQNIVKTEGKNIEEVDPQSIEIKDEDLPKLDDDFVKKMGGFKTVSEFKEKLKENMLQEKTLMAKDKLRGEILDKISQKTTVDVPDVVVENELNRMLAQFKSDVLRTGMKLEDYLKQSGKSEEDMRNEWRPDAEKYGKNQLILNKIALEENITPDEKIVSLEVDKIMANYKDADRTRATIYVETIMINNAIFELLENQT